MKLPTSLHTLAWTMGAFHSTKNSGLNFRNFRMSNGTVFSTRPDRARSIHAWAHFPTRITRQNAERSWWSGSLKCRKVLHVEKFNRHSEFNSSLIFVREFNKLRSFSRGTVCKPGELTHSKFGTTSPQFSRKSDPNVFVENRRSRTGSNYDRSFCLQWIRSVDSKDSPPSCSFSRPKELGPIHTG